MCQVTYGARYKVHDVVATDQAVADVWDNAEVFDWKTERLFRYLQVRIVEWQGAIRCSIEGVQCALTAPCHTQAALRVCPHELTRTQTDTGGMGRR